MPFKHPDIDKWRDFLRHGLEHQIEGTNIVLHGGVDDVWHDLNTGQVIIADYKSQASRYEVATAAYLDNVHHQSYKVQMDVYAYHLGKLAFNMSEISYFYVCNAVWSAASFNGTMAFTETLVPYAWDTSWMEPS